ncbi:MAG TPA: ATP-binding protein [Allosphingosinicella sp.]|nr:ATP-binding protein [Allosphingosinicella sp.]
MRRLLPKSLIGQIALIMAAALLVAQAINFGVIFNERRAATRAQIEAPAVVRFVTFAQRISNMPEDRRDLALDFASRRGRFSLDAESVVAPAAASPRLTARLRESAETNGLPIRDARAAVSDEVVRRRPPEGRAEGRRGGRRFQTLLLSVRLADGQWFNGRLVVPRPDPWIGARLAGSTLLLYFFLLAAMIWIAARLARPLRELADAADRFQGRGETPRVEPRGPSDVSRAIHAFNAMSARVSAMLDEKDRMLGAIGHDLRTPLASLRIRAEYMEPEAERAKVVATIEEMTEMLDDTLALARSGRPTAPVRKVDLEALADAVVEEFRTLGEDVEMESGERRVAEVRPNLLRRALRNLIENGVKYGGGARVAVRAAGGEIAIEVADSGPGIPEDEIGNVQEAFVRLEGSRNRATGGSGLGLALARSAAHAHGGRLELVNRPEGGLLARLLLPA